MANAKKTLNINTALSQLLTETHNKLDAIPTVRQHLILAIEDDGLNISISMSPEGFGKALTNLLKDHPQLKLAALAAVLTA